VLNLAGANTSAKRATDKTHEHAGEDFPFDLESDDPGAEEWLKQKSKLLDFK
jgi:hypothetical protein